MHVSTVEHVSLRGLGLGGAETVTIPRCPQTPDPSAPNPAKLSWTQGWAQGT